MCICNGNHVFVPFFEEMNPFDEEREFREKCKAFAKIDEIRLKIYEFQKEIEIFESQIRQNQKEIFRLQLMLGVIIKENDT